MTHDAYILIHPERWPSSDYGVIAEGWTDEVLDSVADFDTAYGQQVAKNTSQCKEHILVLDDYAIEEVTTSLVEAGLITFEQESALPQSELLEMVKTTSVNLEDFTPGVGAQGWDIFEAEAVQVARVAVKAAKQMLTPGASILIGGYARRDCVKRVAAALNRHGYDVTVCETTTLPLEKAGVDFYTNHYAKTTTSVQ